MRIMILGNGVVGTAMKTICIENGVEYRLYAHKDLDIKNIENVKVALEQFKPTILINASGIVGYKACDMYPVESFAINGFYAGELAKLCNIYDIIYVYISTHAVFDGKDKSHPYSENDTPNPLNTYAISKYSGELYTKAISKKYYIIRFPTLYGKRENSNKGIMEKFFNIMDRPSMYVSIDKIDSPTYNIDGAKALLSILTQELPYGLYHINNSGAVSYMDFVKRIKQKLNKDIELIECTDDRFPPLIKPSFTPMVSVKLPKLRPWEEALEEYLNDL